MAVRTRLELATPCVTGMYSNQTELPNRLQYLKDLSLIASAKVRLFLILTNFFSFFDENNLEILDFQWLYFSQHPAETSVKARISSLFSAKFVPLQNNTNTKYPYQINNKNNMYNKTAQIRNIIFDFGGVIHDIRYENVGEAFVRHGITNLGDFYSKDFQTPEMDQFEKGLLSPAEYRDYIRTMTGHNLSDSDIDDIVNAILIDVPAERVELLLRLRERYNTFLFSNTNQINYDCFTERLRAKYGFDIFQKCFNAAYFSHFMHCRKPSPEGFHRILSEQHLVPEETLFIDDIAKNLEGARTAGLKTLHLAKSTILDLFDDNLNLK